jgi:hypothetical protein
VVTNKEEGSEMRDIVFDVPGIGRTLGLSSQRFTIAQRLAQRAWFQATDPGLQVLLLTLPEDAEAKNDWTGLLADLADRPEKLGGVRQLRLVALLRGNFGRSCCFRGLR